MSPSLSPSLPPSLSPTLGHLLHQASSFSMLLPRPPLCSCRHGQHTHTHSHAHMDTLPPFHSVTRSRPSHLHTCRNTSVWWWSSSGEKIEFAGVRGQSLRRLLPRITNRGTKFFAVWPCQTFHRNGARIPVSQAISGRKISRA